MRCYYHHDLDAVGTCKNCGRGLCPGCAVDVNNGLACRGRCEEEVRSLNRVISRNKTAFEKTSGAYVRVACFYAAVGAVLVAAGILDWRGMAAVLLPAGGILLVAAVVHYTTGRRFERE
jgi:Flp pilus assembly protein TadB